ncbi:MAG: hypothetical protein RIM84_27060 [Alphaproteobacteria bacterium]
MNRFAALCLLVLCATPAAAEIAGTWQVLEKDPLLDDDNWFGLFRYELVIERSGEGYVLNVPRTGAQFGPATLKNGRLVAQGDDPNRGPARIELRFPEPTRLEGRLDVGQARRVLTGTLDPSQQLANVGDSVENARQRAAAADQRAAAAEAQAGQSAAEAKRLRQQIAALSAENQRLKVAAAAPRPAPPPAPRPTVSRPAAAADMTLELIEPPLDTSGTAIVRGERPVLVGRVRAPAGLMILRVNGEDAQANAQGVFQTALAAGTATVEVVAIDRNGTRRSLNFAVRAAAPPLRTASATPAAGPAPVDDSPAARCYALAIAAPKPDDAALGPCREAVRTAPEQAINHYNLGVALSRVGRHAEAIMAYQEAAGRWAR